jgi:chaperone required for assembly of F1-ATPase
MKTDKTQVYFVKDSMQKKIDFFNSILDSKRILNIQIHFFADNKHITIYQADSPYNLEHELRNLLEAMIDQLHNDFQTIQILENEKCKD